MVHLAAIPTDKAVEPAVESLKKFTFKDIRCELPDDNDPEDPSLVSVYGSHYAAEDLPKHEMPEKEMPKEVVYRMIKDDLTLDGNPTLNLASFVTTYMEEEAEKLMVEGFAKNFIGESAQAEAIGDTQALVQELTHRQTTRSTPSPQTSRTAACP